MDRSGFTILEVLIAATIFTIIAGTVITLLISTTNFFDVASIDADLANRAEVIMERLTSELNGIYRDQLSVTNSASQLEVSYTAVVSWDTINNIPNYGSPPALRKFIWDKTAETLSFTTTGGTPEVIARGVPHFDLQFISNSSFVRYVVFLTLNKELTPNQEWITHERREEIYLLPEPK